VANQNPYHKKLTWSKSEKTSGTIQYPKV